MSSLDFARRPWMPDNFGQGPKATKALARRSSPEMGSKAPSWQTKMHYSRHVGRKDAILEVMRDTKLDQLNPPLHITQLRPATASGEEIESAHSLIDADPTAGLQHDDLPADTVAQLGANF